MLISDEQEKGQDEAARNALKEAVEKERLTAAAAPSVSVDKKKGEAPAVN
jgi:hypothetical protein